MQAFSSRAVPSAVVSRALLRNPCCCNTFCIESDDGNGAGLRAHVREGSVIAERPDALCRVGLQGGCSGELLQGWRWVLGRGAVIAEKIPCESHNPSRWKRGRGEHVTHDRNAFNPSVFSCWRKMRYLGSKSREATAKFKEKRRRRRKAGV